MSILTIRKVDEHLKSRLRITAAEQGVSMEEQVRIILRQALLPNEPKKSLGSRIHQRFTELGGIDLKLPLRTASRTPPDFSK